MVIAKDKFVATMDNIFNELGPKMSEEASEFLLYLKNSVSEQVTTPFVHLEHDPVKMSFAMNKVEVAKSPIDL